MGVRRERERAVLQSGVLHGTAVFARTDSVDIQWRCSNASVKCHDITLGRLLEEYGYNMNCRRSKGMKSDLWWCSWCYKKINFPVDMSKIEAGKKEAFGVEKMQTVSVYIQKKN